MRILNKISVVGVLFAAVFYLGSCGGSSSGDDASAPANLFSANLTVAKVVSALSSTPSGNGSVILDPVTKTLSGSFTTVNVVNAAAAHIHDGNVGVAGPVVVPLIQSAAGSAIWVVPANALPLTDAQIARLRAGGYYVNIHTVLNPAGEIRGQLAVSGTDPNMFTAILTVAQEVPAPTIPAL